MTSKLLLIVSTAAFALIGCARNKVATNANGEPIGSADKVLATSELSAGKKESKILEKNMTIEPKHSLIKMF